MFGEFWISLPVKDVMKASAFYDALGFQTDFQNGGAETGVMLKVGDKNTIVWLYQDAVFENFARNEPSDARAATEVLLSIYVKSRETVDDLASNAFDAGGTIFSAPAEAFGWLYGCGFTDLDGHRWNVMYKDESKMPE